MWGEREEAMNCSLNMTSFREVFSQLLPSCEKKQALIVINVQGCVSPHPAEFVFFLSAIYKVPFQSLAKEGHFHRG